MHQNGINVKIERFGHKVLPKRVVCHAGTRLLVILDVGEVACDAAFYAELLLPHGTLSCMLVEARSRLVTESTDPCNEVSGILLGTEMAFTLSGTVQYRSDKIVYVTYFMIAVCWVTNVEVRLK